MFKLNTDQPRRKTGRPSERSAGLTQPRWHYLIGMIAIELFLVMLFGSPFLKANPAYALIASPDADLRADRSASYGSQAGRIGAISGPGYSIPYQQLATTTLKVDILSSPWATLDSNDPAGTGNPTPNVFVVEAAVTNNGTAPAADVTVNLNYSEDPANNWVLLPGEDPNRSVDQLAPGEVYYAYWFARYSTALGATHQYTVTANAANANPVVTSDNFYGNPALNKTVQTRSTVSNGSSGIIQTSAQIVVGVAFTITESYDLGTTPGAAIFSPVGNPDFDPSAYRLLASGVRFFDSSQTQVLSATDRLYFPTLPGSVKEARVTYTFIALTASNTQLCSYTVVGANNPKYDIFYCKADKQTIAPITGTLSISLTKQASSLSIQQNQIVTYTINYTNTGSLPLQYVWIWDDISSNVATIVPSSITPPGDPGETTDSRVAWNVGTIPAAGQAGSTGTLTFAVLVDGNGQDLANGTSLVNHAHFGIGQGSLPNAAALTSAVTTTVQAPTIALSKTDGQANALPGDLLTYTLRITNLGSVAATGLVITDALPSGVSPAGTITPSPDIQAGQNLVWNTLGPIPPSGGDLVISIPVLVSSAAKDRTDLINTGTVAYENTAGHVFVAQTATDTTLVQAPVLTITKTALDINGPPTRTGDTIRYTLQVTNTGHYPAFNVTVTDDLPAGVTYVNASTDNGTLAGTGPLTWSIPTLPANSTATSLITVTIDSGQAGRVIANTASVTASNVFDPPDSPPLVCPNGLPEPCEPVQGSPTLTFSKQAEDLNGPPIVVNDAIRYTLLVTNTSGVAALNVTVSDNLPEGVTYVGASPSQGTVSGTDLIIWSIGTLQGDTSASLLITATINPDQAGQVIANTGSVTGSNVTNPPDDPTPICPDGAPEPCDPGHTPVLTTTLALNKTAEDVNGPPLVISDTIRYTLQVTNTGSYTAYNVIVTDDLPDGVTFVDASADQGTPQQSNGTVMWTIPELPALNGNVATLWITAFINLGSAGQTIVNTGSVTAGNVPNPPDNPTPVCPDGSLPVEGICENTPAPEEPKIYLPIIKKNAP